jgi:hypothetical protein
MFLWLELNVWLQHSGLGLVEKAEATGGMLLQACSRREAL